MRTKLLLFGFLIGIAAGATLTLLLVGQKAVANNTVPKPQRSTIAAIDWPDSLDAITAAPENHKVVFENDKIKVLEVTGAPYIFEPLHTHKWPSIMWSASPNFAKAPHRVRNLSNLDILAYRVEFKK
jgi:hypothetical protein